LRSFVQSIGSTSKSNVDIALLGFGADCWPFVFGDVEFEERCFLGFEALVSLECDFSDSLAVDLSIVFLDVDAMFLVMVSGVAVCLLLEPIETFTLRCVFPLGLSLGDFRDFDRVLVS